MMPISTIQPKQPQRERTYRIIQNWLRPIINDSGRKSSGLHDPSPSRLACPGRSSSSSAPDSGALQGSNKLCHAGAALGPFLKRDGAVTDYQCRGVGAQVDVEGEGDGEGGEDGSEEGEGWEMHFGLF